MHLNSAWVTTSPVWATETLMVSIQFLPFKPYQHSHTFLKRFRKPFKQQSTISILTKALIFSLPIPTQPEAMVAQSISSSERALKVHTLSQICWFRCYIPQGRQSTDVEPKSRKTEKKTRTPEIGICCYSQKSYCNGWLCHHNLRIMKIFLITKRPRMSKISLFKSENASTRQTNVDVQCT